MAITHTLLGHMPTVTLESGIAPPNELSGMVASRKHIDIYWCNDDGSGSYLFAFRIPFTNGPTTVIETTRILLRATQCESYKNNNRT